MKESKTKNIFVMRGKINVFLDKNSGGKRRKTIGKEPGDKGKFICGSIRETRVKRSYTKRLGR